MSVYELRAPGARPVKLAVTVGANVSTAPRGTLAIGAGGDRYAWLTKNVQTCNASTARCAALKTPAGELTLDPAWSPDGETLAFVGAARGTASDFRQATIARWYSTRSLWLLKAGGASRPTKLQDTQGAAAPAWSRDGTSLLYVSGDALWLIPRLGSKPEKIAGPLYPPNAWPSYYGQVGWTGQFAWSS
jgi:dipeptidyl aminopeptidase/acylaminoacyl peptidase